MRKQYNKEIDSYREKISKDAIDSSEKDKRIARLESIIEEGKRKRDRQMNLLLIVLTVVGLIILTMLLLACFFWHDSSYNFVSELVNYIDGLNSETQKRICYSLIVLPITGISLLIKVLINLLKRRICI